MRDHIEILEESLALLDERGANYGGVEENFTTTANLVNLITGLNLSPREVCLILHAVKLARLRGNRLHADSYLDGVNYLAFAGGFARLEAAAAAGSADDGA